MGKQTYKNEAAGKESAGVSGFYETFDSGSGVIVPEGMESDFAHNDSGANLSDSAEHGAIPQVPSKK